MTIQISNFSHLTNAELTRLSDHAINGLSNTDTDYYIAFKDTASPDTNEVNVAQYRLVQVGVSYSGTGPKNDIPCISFHRIDHQTAKGGRRGCVEHKFTGNLKKSEKSWQGCEKEFYDDCQAGKVFSIRKGSLQKVIVISESDARQMQNHLFNPVNSFELRIAARSLDVNKVKELLKNGSSLNGVSEGASPLSAVIKEYRQGWSHDTKTKWEQVINELLAHPECDPTIGFPSAIELAMDIGDAVLVKRLLVHSVKECASKRSIFNAVSFCLAKCPKFYSALTLDLNCDKNLDKLRVLTDISPELFHNLCKEYPKVAAEVFHDMQRGCIAEADSYRCEPEVKVSKLVTQRWQYCYTCGTMLSSAIADKAKIASVSSAMSELETHCQATVLTPPGKGKSNGERRWKVNINGIDHHAKTPLMHAASFGNSGMVSNILSCKDVDPNLRLPQSHAVKHITWFQRLKVFFRICKEEDLNIKSTAADFAPSSRAGNEIRRLILRDTHSLMAKAGYLNNPEDGDDTPVFPTQDHSYGAATPSNFDAPSYDFDAPPPYSETELNGSVDTK